MSLEGDRDRPAIGAIMGSLFASATKAARSKVELTFQEIQTPSASPQDVPSSSLLFVTPLKSSGTKNIGSKLTCADQTNHVVTPDSKQSPSIGEMTKEEEAARGIAALQSQLKDAELQLKNTNIAKSPTEWETELEEEYVVKLSMIANTYQERIIKNVN